MNNAEEYFLFIVFLIKSLSQQIDQINFVLFLFYALFYDFDHFVKFLHRDDKTTLFLLFCFFMSPMCSIYCAVFVDINCT